MFFHTMQDSHLFFIVSSLLITWGFIGVVFIAGWLKDKFEK